MTRFHVDLGTEPPRPDRRRNFKQFKSLAKAVRWAKEEREEGNLAEYPDILDDDGNQITIADWDAPEWLTKDELTTRLHAAETSRSHHRRTIERLHEEQRARDVGLIKAGYIPVRVLTAHLRDIRAEHTGGSSDAAQFFGREMFMPELAQTTYTITLQTTGVPTPGDQPGAAPLYAAITAIREGMNK